MRKMAFMSSEFALAEPVPLTFANLTTKSFTRSGALTRLGMCALIRRQWNFDRGILHVPCRRGAALGTQAAMHADVLVLDHDPLRMRESARYVQGLRHIRRGRLEPGTQLRFRAIGRDRETVDRTDVD